MVSAVDNIESTQSHGFGQAIQEGLVIVNNQQSLVFFEQTRGLVGSCAAFHFRRLVHKGSRSGSMSNFPIIMGRDFSSDFPFFRPWRLFQTSDGK